MSLRIWRAHNHRPWTDDEVSILRSLVALRFSYRCIGNMLGRSEDAVCCKVWDGSSRVGVLHFRNMQQQANYHRNLLLGKIRKDRKVK